MSFRVLTVMVFGAAFLTGCGGEGGATVMRPAAPIWCPTSTRPINAKQNESNAPGPGSFDARALLGVAPDRAMAAVAEHGCVARVIERDGHKFILTGDFRANRVNLVVSRGVVTSVGVY